VDFKKEIYGFKIIPRPSTFNLSSFTSSSPQPFALIFGSCCTMNWVILGQIQGKNTIEKLAFSDYSL